MEPLEWLKATAMPLQIQVPNYTTHFTIRYGESVNMITDLPTLENKPVGQLHALINSSKGFLNTGVRIKAGVLKYNPDKFTPQENKQLVERYFTHNMGVYHNLAK